MTKRSNVFRNLVLGASIAAMVAESKGVEIYELTESTSSGIDLTAMPGYADDRIYGPSQKGIDFSGPLKVGTGVSGDNPFTVLGRGKTITVNGAGSGFHSLPLKFRNADGVTAQSELVYGIGQDVSCESLDIGRYNRYRFGYNCGYGDVHLAARKVHVHDGGYFGGYGVRAGYNAGVAMSVTDGAILVCDYFLYVGAQSDERESSLYVSNATVQVKATETTLGDTKGLVLVQRCRMEKDTTESCRVTLAKDGLVEANGITHGGGGSSTISFEGGRYRSMVSAPTLPLFCAYGYNYKGGYPSPRVHVKGANGCPIDIEISYDRLLSGALSGSASRTVNLSGDGGFTKRGAGTLSMNRTNSSTCDYTGTTSILGGGLVVMDAIFKPGRGALNVSEGCFLDLNGFDCSFATAEGAGVVKNGAAEGASILTLGYGDASGSFSLATVGPVNVVKTGTGTLTVTGDALSNAGDLTVSSGTVVFSGDSSSYGTVTVETGGTLDLRGVRFMCASLVNNGTILTDVKTVFASGGDEDQVLNNGLLGLTCGFAKQGTGTLSLYGANTIGGRIEVNEGTLKVQPGIWPGKYFRLDLQKACSSDKTQVHKMLGEFALYDSDGNNVARMIATQNPTDSNSSEGLVEGEVRLGGSDGHYSSPSGCQVMNLFDGNVGTIFNLQYGWGTERVILRLPDATGDVVGYNFNTGHSPEHRLVTWALYGSEDGTSWTKLGEHACGNWDDPDERQKVFDETPNIGRTWYNGGSPYCFSSYSNATGRVFGENATVSVAHGATLDLSDVGMELSRLSVDCSAGAGTILRFTPAEVGVLELVNVDPALLKEGYVLPLTFGEIAEVSRLRTWSVTVDGAVADKLRLHRLPDGGVMVGPKRGLSLVVR